MWHPAGRPLTAFILASPWLLAALPMHAWLDRGHRIAAVFTSDGAGRGGDRRLSHLRPGLSVRGALRRAGVSPAIVASAAEQEALARRIAAEKPDVVVSLGYMRRIRPSVIEAAGGRCLNIHPALLPHYRGPSPTVAMIIDGTLDTFGGATLHVVDDGFDTGPIVAREPAGPIPGLHPVRYSIAAARAAARLMADAVPSFLAGNIEPVPQLADEGSYPRVQRNDLVLGPEMDAARIARMAKAIPWSRALHVRAGDRLVRIGGFRSLGASTGRAGVEVGRFTVAFDCADGHVRLRRQGPLDSPARKLVRYAMTVARA